LNNNLQSTVIVVTGRANWPCGVDISVWCRK